MSASDTCYMFGTRAMHTYEDTLREESDCLAYSPERFNEETHGLKPARHGQSWNLARNEQPENFLAD